MCRQRGMNGVAPLPRGTRGPPSIAVPRGSEAVTQDSTQPLRAPSLPLGVGERANYRAWALPRPDMRPLVLAIQKATRDDIFEQVVRFLVGWFIHIPMKGQLSTKDAERLAAEAIAAQPGLFWAWQAFEGGPLETHDQMERVLFATLKRSSDQNQPETTIRENSRLITRALFAGISTAEIGYDDCRSLWLSAAKDHPGLAAVKPALLTALLEAMGAQSEFLRNEGLLYHDIPCLALTSFAIGALDRNERGEIEKAFDCIPEKPPHLRTGFACILLEERMGLSSLRREERAYSLSRICSAALEIRKIAWTTASSRTEFWDFIRQGTVGLAKSAAAGVPPIYFHPAVFDGQRYLSLFTRAFHQFPLQLQRLFLNDRHLRILFEPNSRFVDEEFKSGFSVIYGVFSPTTHSLTLNVPALVSESDAEALSTIRHELAHALSRIVAPAQENNSAEGLGLAMHYWRMKTRWEAHKLAAVNAAEGTALARRLGAVSWYALDGKNSEEFLAECIAAALDPDGEHLLRQVDPLMAAAIGRFLAAAAEGDRVRTEDVFDAAIAPEIVMEKLAAEPLTLSSADARLDLAVTSCELAVQAYGGWVPPSEETRLLRMEEKNLILEAARKLVTALEVAKNSCTNPVTLDIARQRLLKSIDALGKGI